MTALEGIFKVFKTLLWTILNIFIEPLKNGTSRPFIIAFIIIIAVTLVIAFIFKKIKRAIN